jgi:glycosyltransferase involved in cell wall biosynthesis
MHSCPTSPFRGLWPDTRFHASAMNSISSNASTTHLVLIPSYNPGPKVYETVLAARAQWTPVWVIVDGSTDGSGEELQAMAARDDGLRVVVLPHNVLRVNGRKVSNGWANLETLWTGIGDSLFGFRVYPIEPLRRIMHGQRWMRRFDFDPEAVVRMCWSGVKPVNLPATVKYFRPEEGGVSHFNYLRDNLLLTWMHSRLFFGFLLRLPVLLMRRVLTGC